MTAPGRRRVHRGPRAQQARRRLIHRRVRRARRVTGEGLWLLVGGGWSVLIRLALVGVVIAIPLLLSVEWNRARVLGLHSPTAYDRRMMHYALLNDQPAFCTHIDPQAVLWTPFDVPNRQVLRYRSLCFYRVAVNREDRLSCDRVKPISTRLLNGSGMSRDRCREDVLRLGGTVRFPPPDLPPEQPAGPGRSTGSPRRSPGARDRLPWSPGAPLPSGSPLRAEQRPLDVSTGGFGRRPVAPPDLDEDALWRSAEGSREPPVAAQPLARPDYRVSPPGNEVERQQWWKPWD